MSELELETTIMYAPEMKVRTEIIVWSRFCAVIRCEL